MALPDDQELRDAALADEITLVGDLIVAASGADGRLSPDEVDAVLGVRRTPPRTPMRHAPRTRARHG